MYNGDFILYQSVALVCCCLSFLFICGPWNLCCLLYLCSCSNTPGLFIEVCCVVLTTFAFSDLQPAFVVKVCRGSGSSILNVANFSSRHDERNCACRSSVHGWLAIGLFAGHCCPQRKLVLASGPELPLPDCLWNLQEWERKRQHSEILHKRNHYTTTGFCLRTFVILFSLSGDVLHRCRTIFADLTPTWKISNLFPQPAGVLGRVVLHLGFIQVLLRLSLGSGISCHANDTESYIGWIPLIEHLWPRMLLVRLGSLPRQQVFFCYVLFL